MKHLKLFENFQKVDEFDLSKGEVNDYPSLDKKPEENYKKPEENTIYSELTNCLSDNTEESTKCIDKFLSEGNDINTDGCRIARYIARTGYNNIEVIKYLFDKGLDISMKQYMGLIWAFEFKAPSDVIELFINNTESVEALEKLLSRPIAKDYSDLINKRIEELK